MAHFYIRNSLNYNKTVKIDVSFIRGYDVNSNDGDPRWFLELATTEPSASGTKIPPEYINNIYDETKLNQLIDNAVSNISSKIDWGVLLEDTDSPYVYDFFPKSVGGIVPIESNVDISIKDDFPSAGLDLSNISVSLDVDGAVFDITSECEIEGDPFRYNIHWEPPSRVYENYGGV